ncbi:T9SS type A sorting domain-containing protein [Bacteroidota bacterium]
MMKKNFTQVLIGALLTIPMLAQTQNGLFISEITDPLDDYSGRFIELFNAGTENIDFSTVTLYLSRQSNGGTSWGDLQLSGSVAAGETFVIGGSGFESVYGFLPDQETGILIGNGDDAYFLYRDGDHTTGILHDIFGVIDVDGTGELWEYEDSRALRMETVTIPNVSWTDSEWEIITANTVDCDPGTHYGSGTEGGDSASGVYSLTVQNDTVVEGQLVELPVLVSELSISDNIISYQFDLDYDYTMMEYSGIDIDSTLSASGSIVVNSNLTGKLSVSYMNSAAITGIGAIVVLQFNSLIADTTEIVLSNAFLNSIPVLDITNGIAIIKSTTPPSATITYSDSINRYADTLIISASFSESMDPVNDVKISLSGAVTLTEATMTRQSPSVYTYVYPIPKASGEVILSLSNGTDLWGNELVSTPSSGSTFNIIEFVLGDVDDDGQILAYDAALTLQYSVGLDPLPEEDPLPWENWRDSTANVDGIGDITANDAGMILQYSAGIIPDFSGGFKKSLFQADISVRLEENEIVFFSHGELLGLNISAVNESRILGKPVVLDKQLMFASRIEGSIYNIGVCTAYSPSDGSAILRIPIISSGKVTFKMLVNKEEKELTLDLVTGFEDQDMEYFSVYPNPAKDYLLINTGQNKWKEDQRIIIYDLHGKTVMEHRIDQAEFRINLSNYSFAGMYYLQLINRDGTIVSGKKILLH